jgi:thiol-disulfide isomerase/thioredoxin
MKIRLALTLFCALYAWGSHAQNYSVSSFIGDDSEYWSGGYVYDFPSISSNLSAVQDLPFTWTFYGQSVNSYRIAHNGYITFETASGQAVQANTSLPNPSGQNNAIYALWDDWTSAVTVSTKTYGAIPNRVHVITWAGLNFPGADPYQDDMVASIYLYEGCGDFEIVIVDNDIDANSAFFSLVGTTLGCENQDGTVGVEIAGSPNYFPSYPGYSPALYEVHRFHWNGPIVNDAALINLDVNNHLQPGSFTLGGIVRNEGSAVLAAYDVNYTVNGGAVQTSSITAGNEANASLHSWTHNVPITVASANDNLQLKVWVSNINGMADEMNCNDTLVEYVTGISNTSASKKVLLEEFTGAWCGYCIDGAVIMDDLEAQYGEDFIGVGVHDGDEMEFLDSLRTSFSAYQYPSALIDRKQSANADPYESEPIGRGAWSSRVASRLTEYTPVDVDIDRTWDASSRTFTATVTADYTDNSAGDSRIILMIVEDSLTGVGYGWDQANNYNTTAGHPYFGAGNSVAGFVHRHVLKTYVEGGPFGVDHVIPHFVSAGSAYQHQFQFTLPNDWDEEHIYLVAAVAKYSDGNDPMYVGVRGQRFIYNSEEVPLLDPSTSIAAHDAFGGAVLIYPNPTNDVVNVAVEGYTGPVNIEVFALSGQLMQATNQRAVSLQDYAKGMYIFKVAYGDQVKRLKVMKE